MQRDHVPAPVLAHVLRLLPGIICQINGRRRGRRRWLPRTGRAERRGGGGGVGTASSWIFLGGNAGVASRSGCTTFAFSASGRPHAQLDWNELVSACRRRARGSNGRFAEAPARDGAVGEQGTFVLFTRTRQLHGGLR